MAKKMKYEELLLEWGLKSHVIAQLPRDSAEAIAIIAMDLHPLTSEKKNMLIKLAFMVLHGKPSAPILLQQNILSLGQLKELSNEQVELIFSDFSVHQDKAIAAKSALRMIMQNQHNKLNKKYLSYAINPVIFDDEEEISR
jgi:hypothetical protein